MALTARERTAILKAAKAGTISYEATPAWGRILPSGKVLT